MESLIYNVVRKQGYRVFPIFRSHMQKSSVFAAIALEVMLTSCNTRVDSIEYGSNNGKYINIHGSEIYYEEYGSGPPLLLLQGGNGSIRDFRLCIPELSKRFHIVAPDTPGQGRSGLADSLSYELMAEYASEFIDLLGLDSAFVIGWSDGGNTGLILAYNRPDKIRGVVASGANYLLSGYPSLLNDTSDWRSEIQSPQFEIDHKEAIEDYLHNSPTPRDWRKYSLDIHELWHKEVYFSSKILEGIKVPVMIVVGDKDDVTLEHAIDMHRRIKGSQFLVLPNTTHMVFEERRDLITKIATDFFLR